MKRVLLTLLTLKVMDNSNDFEIPYLDVEEQWIWSLSQSPQTEDTIRQFLPIWNWRALSAYQKLSEPLIRETADLVQWSSISRHQKLSEPFITEFKDRVDWACIVRHQKLSEPFILKHFSYIDINEVLRSQKVSEEFIHKFADPGDQYSSACRLQKLSCEFLDAHSAYLSGSDWSTISKTQVLTETFMHKYRYRLNWNKISEFQTMSPRFIRGHENYMIWVNSKEG